MGLLDIFKKNKSADPKTALERKTQTEKYLKSLNIPFIDHLPLIEEEYEAQIRIPQEIAKRILILTYLNYMIEEPEEKEEVIEFLKQQELWENLTENEIDYFTNELTEQDKVNISWRTEAIWLLLWTIKKVDKLDLPIEQVEVSEILNRLPSFMSDTKEFIQTATLQSASDILDLSDLIYRLHWATRETQLKKLKSLDLNPSIVEERHYAINWVTCYEDNWDDISTDT